MICQKIFIVKQYGIIGYLLCLTLLCNVLRTQMSKYKKSTWFAMTNKKYTMEVVLDPPRSVDENNHDYVRLHVECSSEACLKWFAEAFRESSLEDRLVAVFDIEEEEED